ncbi:MAG: polyprenyl synthetase family protein [Tenacibaculum sp.]
MNLLKYQSDFLAYLNRQNFNLQPYNLYKPIEYVMHLGGKRIRPVLTLMASDIISGNYKQALPAALAIEVFHNFTLIHDDIMDKAFLRRKAKTVHNKWNINTAILSGDAMLILAYRYFESYNPTVFKNLVCLMSNAAIKICQGQQWDIDFETQSNISVEQYLKMIGLKTSVLIATALKMGAVVAEADMQEAEYLYKYGFNLGMAFQLQDDYLDTFGKSDTFGKQIGGDIAANKKTYLYLKALEVSKQSDKQTLSTLYNDKQQVNTDHKLSNVISIFKKNRIPFYTQQLIEDYTDKAIGYLELLSISKQAKDALRIFSENLMRRKV